MNKLMKVGVYIIIAMALIILPTQVLATDGSYTEVSNYADFNSAIASGGKIKLTGDIKFDASASITVDKEVVINLNGHNISDSTGTKQCLKFQRMVN